VSRPAGEEASLPTPYENVFEPRIASFLLSLSVEVPVEPPILSDPIEEPHLHLAPPTSFASLVEDAMVEPLHPDRSAPKSTTTSTEDRAARSRARRSARGGSISVAARTSAVYTAARQLFLLLS
jgi:hypothetical protein